MKKLKERWDIDTNFEVIIIFLVFAITGSSSVKIARPLLESIGFTRSIFPEDGIYTFLYWTTRILIIFPIYQLLLVLFGWLFGQFKFFWKFEKKMLGRLGLGFLFK
ncbi:diacylglyceryl transferase [Flavobacteriaceae bacterium KMM 6897]|nr:diacylglyceryl transferase [Flavobacteriaceae bacterium KMM 6897]